MPSNAQIMPNQTLVMPNLNVSVNDKIENVINLKNIVYALFSLYYIAVLCCIFCQVIKKNYI